MKKINYKELNFDIFDKTYDEIIKLSDDQILGFLGDIQDFENKNKGYDFETLILRFLHHKNNKIRLFVTKYIENSSDFSLVRKLRKIIADEKDSNIKLQAIKILGKWIEILSSKNNRKNETNRLMKFGLEFISNSISKSDQNNMLMSISHLSNEEIDKLIIDKFNSKNLDDNITAIISMGNNGNIKWIPLIEDLLENDNHEIRSKSCISLSLIGNEEHLDQIKDLLEDEELDTQKAAVEAIFNIGGPYSKDILEKLRFSPEPEIIELSKNKIAELNKFEELESDPNETNIDDSEKEYNDDDFDEYDAAKIEGWGSLNEDGTSFIAPDAIDEDINDPIKSLSDYEKPIEQPDIDD